MSPFPIALRSELLRARRDRALAWLSIVFAVVSAYGAFSGAGWAAGREKALQSIAAQERADREPAVARMRKAAESNPGPEKRISAGAVAVSVWNYPSLPSTPLAPLAVGQMHGYPYAAKFHAMTRTHRIFDGVGHDVENPENLAAGLFDLAFVIVFVLPLVILAATYDIWAQERETGTSELILSQPLHPGTILAAKAVARGGVLLLVCVVEVGVLLTWLTSAQDTAGVIATGGVMILYGAFWIAVALVVNGYARSSVAAAVGCAAAWLAVVMLLPACLAAAVEVAAPAPSHAMYVNTLREKELELDAQRAVAGITRSDRTQRLRDAVREAQERDAQMAPLVAAHNAQQARRRQLSETMRFLSPAVIAQDALERIAGTDADRSLAFQAQALSFLGSLRTFADENMDPRDGESFESAASRVPVFSFEEVAALHHPAFRADLWVLVAWIAAAAALLPTPRRRSVFIGNFLEKI